MSAVALGPGIRADIRPSLKLRWCVWSIFAIAWTVSLLVPKPIRSSELAEAVASPMLGEESAKEAGKIISIGKIMHVTAYALFTGLSAWLMVSPRRRWLLLVVLAGHGVLTEFLQWLLPTNRTGCLYDVGLDYIGILLGVLLTWKWWPARVES